MPTASCKKHEIDGFRYLTFPPKGKCKNCGEVVVESPSEVEPILLEEYIDLRKFLIDEKWLTEPIDGREPCERRS